MQRIFISYSRKDSDFMKRLQDSLTKSYFETWVDTKNISASEEWSDEVQQALDSCIALLLIISRDSMESKNVKDEWEYFKDTYPQKPLIPILWKSAKKHYRIHGLQHIDFLNQDFFTAFNHLCTTLKDKGIHPAKPPVELTQDVKINRKKTGNLWWLCHDIMELYRWHLENIPKEWVDVGFRQCLHHARQLELDDDIISRLQQLVDETKTIPQSAWIDSQRQRYAGQVRDMFNIIAQRVQAAHPDFDPGPG